MKRNIFLTLVIIVIGMGLYVNKIKSNCPDFEPIANSTIDMLEGNFQITKSDSTFSKKRSFYMHSKPHQELIDIFEDEGEEEMEEVGFEKINGGFTKNGDFYTVEIKEADKNSSIVIVSCKS